MEWWKKPVRVLQFNIEDRYGVYVSSINGKELIDYAERIGANVLVIFARDPWGRTYYRKTSIGPEHPKMIGDLVREAIKAGKEKGIRVVLMVGHTANQYIYRMHSDWAQVNRNGEIILLEHVPYGVTGYEPEWPQLCINSPFIEHIKKEVDEAIDLDPDGIFLDSFRYQPDIERACYCIWCKRRFMEEYGYEMPKEPKWSDSRWRILWDWRYKVVVERIMQLHDLVKSKAPHMLFMYNSHPGGWAGRTNRIVEMARDYVDVVFAECSEADHQPPGFITEMIKLTRAMLGDKPVWASRNYFHLYRTAASTTPLAIRQGLREAIIAGGSPWLLVFSISYRQDPGLLNAAAEVFREHKILEEYLFNTEPIHYAGIVVSNTTRDHYGRGHPERYVDEVRGFYYALVHNHVPVQFIAERDLVDLDKLSKYHVIILANTVCLSSEAVNTLKKYVENGGSIIATYLASTRNGNCIRMHEFSLKDVLGIELVGVLRQAWSYVVLDKKDHPILKNIGKDIILWGDMSYEFQRTRATPTLGRQALVRTISGDEIAYIGLAGGIWGYEYTLGRSPPPFISKLDKPSIVVNKYGNGRSIYFAGQIGRHYWRTGLPEYMKLIINSIKYLGGDLPIEINAPETIALEIYRQGDRIILHLLNHTYNQRIQSIGIGKIRQPLPPYSSSESVHPPKQVIPINNIDITLKIKDNTRYNVFLPLRNEYLDYTIENNKLLFKLPVLKEYEAIVIEPKK